MTDRRSFIKTLLATITAANIPIPEALLSRAEAVIEAPTFGPTEVDVIAKELERVYSSQAFHNLFDRDDKFFETLGKRQTIAVSARDMRIPIILEPKKR